MAKAPKKAKKTLLRAARTAPNMRRANEKLNPVTDGKSQSALHSSFTPMFRGKTDYIDIT